jgi:DNA-binding CsgD family transcriptional regulator
MNNIAADITTRVAALSPLQRETLRLRADGFSCKQTALAMKCSPGAVKDRMLQVRQRLDVGNTYEAVVALHRAENLRLKAGMLEALAALQQYNTEPARRALSRALDQQGQP